MWSCEVPSNFILYVGDLRLMIFLAIVWWLKTAASKFGRFFSAQQKKRMAAALPLPLYRTMMPPVMASESGFDSSGINSSWSDVISCQKVSEVQSMEPPRKKTRTHTDIYNIHMYVLLGIYIYITYKPYKYIMYMHVCAYHRTMSNPSDPVRWMVWKESGEMVFQVAVRYHWGPPGARLYTTNLATIPALSNIKYTETETVVQ